MRTSSLVLVILLASCALLLTEHSAAQSVYGQVWGRLTSDSGTPVSGAAVNLVSIGTDARVGAKSNPDGSFAINNLSADHYQIEVRADGFKTVQSTIVVSGDSTTTVNVPLKAGDSKTIERSNVESVLQMNRTDVFTLFDSRAIADLPILDRNVTRLELLVPGASRGQLFIPPPQNPQQGQPVNINGQHFSGGAFQLDGTENRDPLEGIVVINPTLDSVQEMKVTTQGYNAEFGQATAGVVTIQTRSGSNSWHGDAFGLRRTGWGESENPFAPAGVPPEKHGIFGGALGGPIKRDKLFIFGDYQGTRIRQGGNLLLSVLPDSVRDTCLQGQDCNLSAYSNFIDGDLHDDDQSKTVFPNYTIPAARIVPQAIALLSLLPASNHTSRNPICGKASLCDNYLASGEEIFSGNQFDVRGDYDARPTLRLFGRYSFGGFTDDGTPAFGTVAGGFGTNPLLFAGSVRTRNQGISTGFTDTLGQRLIVDARFGYFRYRLNSDSPDMGQTPDIKIPNIFPPATADPFATGLPDIQIPGQANNGPRLSSSTSKDYIRFGYSSTVDSCNCPLREREQQFQFANNWTLSMGSHNVKWGGDVRFLQNYRLASDDRRTGFFSFAPGKTGLALATLLIGDVTSFNRTVSTPAATDAGEHQKRFGFYGQDTWRVSPRFTLDYGLRWEIYFAQSVTGAGRGSFLIPNLASQDPAETFFNVAQGDNTGGVSTSFKNFAPRLGFAFLLNPTTVVRAGYGRSFDAGYAGSIFGIAPSQTPPVTVDQKIEAGGFNLRDGPPTFNFPITPQFSLLDLATANRKLQAGSGACDPITPNATCPPSGAILYALPSRMRIPTVDSWNLAVQHELASGLYFELAYIGNKGTHVFPDNGSGTYYDLNQSSLQHMIVTFPQPGGTIPTICSPNQIFDNSSMQHAYCLSQPRFRSFYNSFPIDSGNCGKTGPCFDPTLFQVRYFGNDASDNYNSLQAKLQKSFSRGFSFMAHYTFSKGLDYDSNYFRVDPSVGYGPARFDVTHRFVMTNIWNLPIGRGHSLFGGVGPAGDRFLGGWILSGVTIWRSGLAFTPSYNDCRDDVDTGSPCRPNRVGVVQVSNNRNEAFTTSDPLMGNDCNSKGFCGVDPNGNPSPGLITPGDPWQRPGAGQIGDVGRNSLRGPSFFQSDIGIAKVINISERANMRFRADVFNVFNKVNLGNPNPCVDCQGPQGGGVISSLSPGAVQREFQFSLRFQF